MAGPSITTVELNPATGTWDPLQMPPVTEAPAGNLPATVARGAGQALARTGTALVPAGEEAVVPAAEAAGSTAAEIAGGTVATALAPVTAGVAAFSSGTPIQGDVAEQASLTMNEYLMTGGRNPAISKLVFENPALKEYADAVKSHDPHAQQLFNRVPQKVQEELVRIRQQARVAAPSTSPPHAAAPPAAPKTQTQVATIPPPPATVTAPQTPPPLPGAGSGPPRPPGPPNVGGPIGGGNGPSKEIAALPWNHRSYQKILFGIDQATLTKADKDALRQLAQDAKETGSTIDLAGHASTTGSVDHNQVLSQERVDASAEFLVKECGVDSKKIKKEADGSTKSLPDATGPKVENADNRSVTYTLESGSSPSASKAKTASPAAGTNSLASRIHSTMNNP